MAVTSIWAVKDSIKDVLSYIENSEKTEFSAMKNALHYIADDAKTEKKMFVTGVNCVAPLALTQMMNTKKKFAKTGGYVAFHGYQSFKTGEVSASQAHEIGLKLAREMWGEKYEVMVATHLNTNTIHNHYVINSVSFVDGKKLVINKWSHLDLRRVSDLICKNYGLSTIENPKSKTPRNIYLAEKNGDPTRYNLMREAIDFATKVSFTREQFFKVMYKKGYVLDFRESLKYPTIRSRFSNKNTRIHHLGKEYLPTAIYERISQNRNTSREYYEFMEPRPVQYKKYRLVGSLKTAKKITGIKALYFHYMYLLGYLPKNKPHKALSPEMREECRKVERYSKQIRLIAKQGLDTELDVTVFIEGKTGEIITLNAQRNSIYNQLRRCADLEKEKALYSQRDTISQTIKTLRTDKKVAEGILLDLPKFKQNIQFEQQIKHEQLSQKTKQKERGYYR